ncbi:MAG TPA: hypothetical protein ENK98_02735 [Epsilonproteobacteria bacterium]|nr:hypothetical protein [Campylobacterota bacterium]
MKVLFYAVSCMAILITFMESTSSIAKSFMWFAVSPYIVVCYLIYIAKHQTAFLTAAAVTLFIVLVGLYFLLDTTYMDRNLGDKFSFLFIPLWQWTMLIVSGFVIYLSNDKQNKETP